jgi:hypothetical protein
MAQERKKRPRNVLELKDRLEIIRIKEGEKLMKRWERFKVGRTTVGDIMKHKEKYLTAQERKYNPCATVIKENEFMNSQRRSNHRHHEERFKELGTTSRIWWFKEAPQSCCRCS